MRASVVGLVAAAALAPVARSSDVAVMVVRSIDPMEVEEGGAQGLLVPGSGSTVTRAGALSSLLRGKVTSSLLGGTTSGKPLIRLAREQARLTILVTLPPPGRSHNTRRYRIAIVGAGYRGILTSHSTRIPGLVSIADVAPTAVALAEGRSPPIRWRGDDFPATTLHDLDRRLARAHDSRTGATIVLVAATLVLAGLALILRSTLFARAGLLAIPAALATALTLSALDVSRPAVATSALAAATPLAALAVAVRRSLLLPALALFVVAELIVLAAWPEVNSLAIIGPHPDGGGRYYGITNQVETLMLAPVLAGAALAPSRLFALLGALALVLVGWSRAGADGGGIVVFVVALAALWAATRRVRVTTGRVALAVAGAATLVLAFVGLDAITGGSSHVTRAVGSGPDSLIGDLGHRLHVSWEGVTATTQASVAAGATLVVLLGLAVLRPRVAVVDALLVAVVASLLVNDTPTDVLAYGALAATALRVWVTVDAPVSARSGAELSPRATPAPTWR
jgi:hypothetical protein